MKQLELNLNKRLLIVEFDDMQHLENVISCDKQGIRFCSDDDEQTKLICQGPELTEDKAMRLVEHKWMPTWGTRDYTNESNHFTTALDSFISSIEASGYHWGDNPVNEPRMSDYGWYASGHPEEDSGWMYEEGEDKYHEALKSYEESKSRTFNPDKTIIFEIL